MKAPNLVLCFLPELVALGVLGHWGATMVVGGVRRVALAMGIPLAAAVFRATFMAPRARVVLPTVFRTVQGPVVFACGAAVLVDRGHARPGALSRSWRA